MDSSDILVFGAGIAVSMAYLYNKKYPNLSLSQDLSGVASGLQNTVTGSTSVPSTTVPSGISIVGNANIAYTISISNNTYDCCGLGNNANVAAIAVTDDGTGYLTSKTFTSNSFVNYNGMFTICLNKQYRTIITNGTNVATALTTSMPCPSVAAQTQSASQSNVFYTNGTTSNSSSAQMSAAGNNVGLYNDPNVLKRPVAVTTINSIYQQSPYLNDFTPLSTNN